MGCLFHSEFLEITFSIVVNCLLVMDFFFNAPRCPLSFSFGFAELCLKDRTINIAKPRIFPAIFILVIEFFSLLVLFVVLLSAFNEAFFDK